MGFLDSLFGPGKPEEQLRQEAGTLLSEVEDRYEKDPKSAAKRFYRAFEGGVHEPFIDFGEALHVPCAALLLRIVADQGAAPRFAYADLPACNVYTDPGPGDWEQAIEHAEADPGACSFIRFPSLYAGHRLTLAGVEALRLMAFDARVAVVCPGSEYPVLRNAVLAKVGQHFDKPFSHRALYRDLDDILVGQLGLDEMDEWVGPTQFDMFVYRARLD